MVSVLCECGCGQPAPIAKRTNAKRGQVAGHPVRFIFAHKAPSKTAMVAAAAHHQARSADISGRFAAMVPSGLVDGCLEWKGARDRRGYGMFVIRGINHRAHRVAWMLAHGPVAASEAVCHRCDNPSCVNVAHLFVGSAADNVADCVMKGRARGGSMPGAKNPSAKLTENEVMEIRRRVAAGEPKRAIARRFGVVPSVVADIHNRRTWRQVGISRPLTSSDRVPYTADAKRRTPLVG